MTRFVGVLAFVISLAPAVRAGEHPNPSGFALSYPTSWEVLPIDAETYESLKHEIPACFRRALDRMNFDPSQIDVFVARIVPDGFSPNVNVLTINREMPLSQKSIQEAISELARGVNRTGLTVTKPRAEYRALNGQQALVLDYKIRHDELPDPIQYRQAAFVGNGRTYIVTCAAEQRGFAAAEKDFEAILGSFKTTKPQSKFDLKRFENVFQWTPRVQRIIISSAILAVVILFLKMLFG